MGSKTTGILIFSIILNSQIMCFPRFVQQHALQIVYELGTALKSKANAVMVHAHLRQHNTLNYCRSNQEEEVSQPLFCLHIFCCVSSD